MPLILTEPSKQKRSIQTFGTACFDRIINITYSDPTAEVVPANGAGHELSSAETLPNHLYYLLLLDGSVSPANPTKATRLHTCDDVYDDRQRRSTNADGYCTPEAELDRHPFPRREFRNGRPKLCFLFASEA
jgi:hypothetical protein